MPPRPKRKNKKPAKLLQNNSNDEQCSEHSDNDDNSDDDETTITSTELKEILHDELLKQEEKLKAHITEKFLELNAELAITKQIAEEATMRAEVNQQKIET